MLFYANVLPDFQNKASFGAIQKRTLTAHWKVESCLKNYLYCLKLDDLLFSDMFRKIYDTNEYIKNLLQVTTKSFVALSAGFFGYCTEIFRCTKCTYLLIVTIFFLHFTILKTWSKILYFDFFYQLLKRSSDLSNVPCC